LHLAIKSQRIVVNMVWDQLEPTPPHLTYLLLSTFLISYVLFVRFFRNRREFREAIVNE
jgi:hypothetical protein